jgi:hypothetical protein
MATVNIQGLDKAAVLKALHDGASAFGMGLYSDLGRDMTLAEAAEYTNGSADDFFHRSAGLRFDYVRGRPIKADITDDTFDPWLYDRDAGQGQAERVIASLRGVAGQAELR